MPARDLTRPLGPDTPVYPGDPPVRLEAHATLADEGYRVTALSLGSHAGTHVDAPSHVEPAGAAVDAVPVERFRFDAARVAVDAESRAPIEPAVLDDVPDGVDCLAVDTGWADRWGTDAYWDHPYLAPETAERCADRGLAVALDAPSPDPSPAPAGTSPREAASPGPAPSDGPDLPAHRALLGAGRPVVENLATLSGLPERFVLRAYPLPLVGGDASPVRAVAEW